MEIVFDLFFSLLHPRPSHCGEKWWGHRGSNEKNIFKMVFNILGNVMDFISSDYIITVGNNCITALSNGIAKATTL